MDKFKLAIGCILLVLFIGLGFTVIKQSNHIKELNSSLLVATNNNKAYEAERDSLKDKARQY